MVKLYYDLHIHSCLSPCGDDDMIPANIAGMSALKELDIIAVTDHNSCRNCEAVLNAAKNYNLIVIPGMELCTIEEVHVLCLFDSFHKALLFDEYVYDQLIKIANNEEIFGKQEIYDHKDNLIAREPNLLINATNISFDEVYDLVKKYDGIIIPAHIDKSSNGLLSNLGFVPPESKFEVIEVIDLDNPVIKGDYYLSKCNMIANSDAHSLHQISERENFIYSESRSRRDILRALVRQSTSGYR